MGTVEHVSRRAVVRAANTAQEALDRISRIQAAQAREIANTTGQVRAANTTAGVALDRVTRVDLDFGMFAAMTFGQRFRWALLRPLKTETAGR